MRKRKNTHILQHLHLSAHALELLVILALQLAQHGVRVLSARIRRRGPERASGTRAAAAAWVR